MKHTKLKIFKNQSNKKMQVDSEKISENTDINKRNLNTKKKKSKSVIYNIIIAICVVVITFSLYKIICWALENNKSKTMLNEVQSSVKITQEEIVINNQPIVKTNYDFSELLKKNSQTVGWINVPNTKIDYPVVQASDNDFYLHHSFDKSSNSAGWVFADYTCNVQSSQNLLIYGHNRRDLSMFGSLKSILDDNWRSNPENLYINFADENGTGVYKVFSTFICNDADVSSYLETNFSTKEDLQQYITKLKKCSIYKFDTDIENAEKMITLYTCYGANNQRLLVCAVKVY